MSKAGGLVLLLIFWSTLSYAQSKNEVDSLNRLADSMHDTDQDSVEYFANQAYKLSLELGYVVGEIEALANKCFSCYVRGESSKAIEYCQLAIDLDKEDGIETNAEEAVLYLGLVYMSDGEFEKAIEQFSQLVDFATKNDNRHLLADACSNLGLAYLNLSNLEKAKQYYLIALNVHDELNHPHGEVYIKLNLGGVYKQLHEPDSALKYYNNTAQMALTIGANRPLYYVMCAMAEMNQFELSERSMYADSALQISRRLNWQQEVLRASLLSGNIAYENKAYKKALMHWTEAERLTLDHGQPESLGQLYKDIIRVLTFLGELDKVNMYLAKYRILSDSIAYDDEVSFMDDLLKANELAENEREINKVRKDLAEAEVKVQNRSLTLYAVIAGLVIVLLAFFFSFRIARIKTRAEQSLKRVNKELDKAVKDMELIQGMIAHDLRSPLNTLESLVELISEKESNQEVLSLMKKTIASSKVLTDELIEINELESGSQTIRNEHIEVNTFFSGVIGQFESRAKKKKIELIENYDLELEEVNSDPIIVQRVVENLVSNAIKFSKERTQVKVHVGTKPDEMILTVEDNGPGIPLDEQELLFTKFGKTSNRPTGEESSSGLGLFIVKCLIDNLRGHIAVTSKPKVGTKFVVTIPILSSS